MNDERLFRVVQDLNKHLTGSHRVTRAAFRGFDQNIYNCSLILNTHIIPENIIQIARKYIINTTLCLLSVWRTSVSDRAGSPSDHHPATWLDGQRPRQWDVATWEPLDGLLLLRLLLLLLLLAEVLPLHQELLHHDWLRSGYLLLLQPHCLHHHQQHYHHLRNHHCHHQYHLLHLHRHHHSDFLQLLPVSEKQ